MKSTPPSPADPEAWNAYLAEGNATQARKRVSADAIVRDPAGRVLLVKPTYKPGWDLPGGMAEDNEAPEDTVSRELREELSLAVTPLGLLVADWVAPHGPWDDQIAFIFDGGTLARDQAEQLHPGEDDGEVEEVAFVAVEEAADWLPDRVGRRFAAAMEALASGCPRYLRDGGGR
ncbi:NUDIX hydrolase [Streptomyces durbertensis]|uniref:NUDIX hydrolase n=1 Tax=Streptomyces durbertensis TaxID=2448886 RepID=A0ABR6EIC5_9ACTN|nr:NUDIX hydrolase [Streptomyces durbertensis]MBB1245018.1 NUDIX hydrolase [Streptomyces durbertensis]